MTLQELSDAWNELAHSLRAPMPAELKAEVQRNYENFRAWLFDLGPFDELRERVIASDDAKQWVATFNRVRLQVQGAGQPVPPAFDEPRGILGDVAATAQSLLFVVALGAGAALIFARRGRR